jgi:16S rRNA (guanine966-N2)-methyltransferase
MRVIAGSARSIHLKTLDGNATRPIPDRIKKSLFSILDARGRIAEARVLDLYAGGGTIGIEALSRGASSCTFVERSTACRAILCENLRATRLEKAARVIASSVEAYLAGPAEPVDLAFLDPPFEITGKEHARKDFERVLAASADRLVPGGWAILRLDSRAEPFAIGSAVLFREWRDGRQKILFYERQG